MTAYHPDDSGLLSGPTNPKDEAAKRKRKGGNGLLAPFMPGDQQMLADQLSMGFGGSPEANMAYLSKIYSRMPMNFNYRGFGGGMGGGGQGGPQAPTLPPNGLTVQPRVGPVPTWKTSPPGRNV